VEVLIGISATWQLSQAPPFSMYFSKASRWAWETGEPLSHTTSLLLLEVLLVHGVPVAGGLNAESMAVALLGEEA